MVELLLLLLHALAAQHLRRQEDSHLGLSSGSMRIYYLCVDKNKCRQAVVCNRNESISCYSACVNRFNRNTRCHEKKTV